MVEIFSFCWAVYEIEWLWKQSAFHEAHRFGGQAQMPSTEAGAGPAGVVVPEHSLASQTSSEMACALPVCLLNPGNIISE